MKHSSFGQAALLQLLHFHTPWLNPALQQSPELRSQDAWTLGAQAVNVLLNSA